MTTNKLRYVSDMDVGDIPKQYFSKWRNSWVDFKQPPGVSELLSLRRYKYQLK